MYSWASPVRWSTVMSGLVPAGLMTGIFAAVASRTTARAQWDKFGPIIATAWRLVSCFTAASASPALP